MKTYIYTLSHPITNEIRYIGKTVNLSSRYYTYIKQAKNSERNNLVINWVKSLLKIGLKPKMEVIDEIDGEWEWLEQYWISQFKTWGFKLKNMTEGGDINPMDDPIIRKKVSEKLKGVPKTQTHKDKISKTKKGTPIHSIEQKEKYSKKNSGKGNPMYNKKHTNEALNKMKLVVLQYTLDGEFIREWQSAADVERETNMLARSINRCAKGDRATAYGYIWSYKNKKGRV